MGRKAQAEKFYQEFLIAFMIDHDIAKTLSYFTDNVSVAYGSIILCGKQAYEAAIKKQFKELQLIIDFLVERLLVFEIDDKNYSLVSTVLLQKKGRQGINENLRLQYSLCLHFEEQEIKIAMIHTVCQREATKQTSLSNNKEECLCVYKEAWEQFGSPVCITDANRNVVYLNQASLEILQKPIEQCLGRSCKNVWNFDICGTKLCGIECLQRGVGQTCYDTDAKRVKVETCYLKNPQGENIGHMEIGNDITEIEELTEKFQSMSANIPGGVCQIRLDEYYTLLYGNEAFFEILGCTRERMQRECKNHLVKYLTFDQFSYISNAFSDSRRLEQKEVAFETKLIRPDGLELWVLVRATLVKNGTVANAVIIDITERKNMEKELHISEERLRGALERNFTNVFDYDLRTRQMLQPDSIAALYGINRAMENVPDSILASGIICEDSMEDFRQVYEDIFKGIPSVSKMIKTITKDGEIRYNRFSMSSIMNDDGNPIRAIGLIEDITKQQNMKMAFLQEEQYRSAMLSDVQLYFEMNLTKDTYEKCRGDWKHPFEGEANFCYSSFFNETLNRFIPEAYKQIYKDTFSLENAVNSFHKGVYQLSLEYKRYMSEGRLTWVSSTMNLVKDIINGDIKGFMYVKDIDEQKKTELKLVHASSHDSLTGLLNKACTEALVRETLEKNDTMQHAFLILDVDHFKNINDTYGHYIGDYILTEVSNSLSLLLRAEDVIGRIGGDEFVIFIRNIPSISYVTGLAETICKNFWVSLTHKEDIPVISCSIGVSISKLHGDTFEDLYKNADYALYKAKQLGRNRFIQYNSSYKNSKLSTND